MKLLLVEDNPTYVDILAERVNRIPGVTLTTAKSRDSALQRLEAEAFDLIVCDLRIPTFDGQLDSEDQHGASVIAAAADRFPGTPIVIFSAFGSRTFAVSAVSNASRRDVIGDGIDQVMVGYRGKEELDACISDIADFARRLEITEAIEIRRAGGGVALSAEEARLIRIFARLRQAVIVELDRITGGFSQTTTFKVSMRGQNGQLRGLALAKVGALAIVSDEAERFANFVASVLPPGSFAMLQHHVQAGAGNAGALFFQLAAEAPSLFVILRDDPGKAARVVDTLAGRLSGWLVGAPQEQISIESLRSMVARTDVTAILPLLVNVDYTAIEALKVFVRRAVQHGDLHAGNVLVFDGDQPVLIDFGEVRELVAGYDPVALELSLLFHPSGAAIRGTWPATEQLRSWDNLDLYVENCPVAAFVRECRRWALVASPSDRGVIACAYAHAMRQLRYPDTNKDLARDLIACAQRYLLATS